MNVDVLIWGGTHKVEAYALEGKFFVNPGSATGAFTTEWPDVDLEDEGEKNEGEETEDKEENEDKREDQDKEDKEEEAKEEEDGNDDDDEAEETNDIIPSFTLLDVQGSVITLYIYTYINGDVKVDKVSYRKDQ